MAITPGNQTSQTPANQAFSVMKTEVARYVKAPNSTEILGVAGDGINDAVRRLNGRIWEWNFTSEEITLVGDQKEYDVNDTIKLPRHLELLNSSDVASGGRILYMAPKEFLVRFTDRTGSGEPRLNTVLNPRNYGQLTFNQAPSSSWVAKNPKARHWYYRYLQTLSAAGDTLAVPNDVERVILWSAKQYVAEMYGSTQQIQVATARYEQGWMEMKKQHRRDDTDWASPGQFRRW
jgi:hypothetical protein